MRGSLKTGANIETAKAVGKRLAERAAAKGIKEVVFDRGGYLYHGRVQALAGAAREGGLSFWEGRAGRSVQVERTGLLSGPRRRRLRAGSKSWCVNRPL